MSPALPFAEVGWLAGRAAPDALALLSGDANSLTPAIPVRPDWDTLPAHQRARYVAPGSATATGRR